MITPNAAIDKAITFLGSLNPELLGGKPQDIRLETVQLSGTAWVVMLSYTITIPRNGENFTNQLMEVLSTRRYIKEFEIDGATGETLGMKNPLAPASSAVRIAA